MLQGSISWFSIQFSWFPLGQNSLSVKKNKLTNINFVAVNQYFLSNRRSFNADELDITSM